MPVLRGWREGAPLSDAIDTVASLLAGNSIPPAIRWPCVALGASSAALAAQLARQFDEPPEAIPGETPESALTGHPAQP